MVYDNRYDGARLLSLGRAILGQHKEMGLTDDDSIVLVWEKLTPASLSELKNWAKENRRSLSGKDVDFQHIEGIYRSIQIETKVKDKTGYLYHTFAKGLYTELDWTSARLIQVADYPEKDSYSVNTYQPQEGEKYLSIEFPYIDPLKIKDVIDSVEDTYSDFSIEGQTYSGLFHRVHVTPKKTEEGDLSLVMLLARPQFVVDAYREWETRDQETVKELWGVPKRLVETVLSEWKEEGRSARVSYSKGLAQITLSESGSEGARNVTIIKSDCSQVSTAYYFWGVKASAIENDVYQVDYDDSDEGDSTNYVYNYDTPGHIVDKRISPARKGKYDIVITDTAAKGQDLKWLVAVDKDHDRKLEEHEAMTPEQFTSWLAGGLDPGTRDNYEVDFGENEEGKEKSVLAKIRDDCLLDVSSSSTEVDEDGDDLEPEWYESDYMAHHEGYYWSKTKEDIEAAFSSGGTADWAQLWKSETGKHKQVKITRRDDGSFDMHVDVVTYSKVEGESSTSGTGVDVKVKAAIGAESAPSVKVGKRKRHSLRMEVTPEGLFNYTLQETKVQGGAKTKTVGDLTLYHGKDQDSLLGTDLSKKVGDGSIRIQDDGSYSWDFKARPLRADQFALSDADSYRTINDNINQDTATLDAEELGEDEVLDTFRVSMGDNGKWNYTLSKHALMAKEHSANDEFNYHQEGINQDDLPKTGGETGYKFDGDVLDSIRISQGENGKLNYSIRSHKLETSTPNINDTVNYVEAGLNKDSLGSATGDVLESMSVTLGEKGKLNYSIKSHGLDSGTIDDYTGNEADDAPVKNKFHFGYNEESLPELEGHLNYASATRGELGRWNYRISEKETTGKETPESGEDEFVERWLPQEMNRYGYTDTLFLFSHVAGGDVPRLGEKEFGGYISLRMNDDDGTLTGILKKRDYAADMLETSGTSSVEDTTHRYYRTDTSNGDVLYRDIKVDLHLGYRDGFLDAMHYAEDLEDGLYIMANSVSIRETVIKTGTGTNMQVTHGYRVIKKVVTCEDSGWTKVGEDNGC